MYTSVKVNYFSSLTYTSVFCLRRLFLVCLFLGLHKHSIWLILTYNILQSFYFWYIIFVMPHEEIIHNRLELFNELCLMCIQYFMIPLIPGSGVDPEVQWNIGIVMMVFVGFVFLINFIVLIFMTVCRLIFFCRVKKARKAFIDSIVRRNAIKKLDTKKELNDARDVS